MQSPLDDFHTAPPKQASAARMLDSRHGLTRAALDENDVMAKSPEVNQNSAQLVCTSIFLLNLWPLLRFEEGYSQLP